MKKSFFAALAAMLIFAIAGTGLAFASPQKVSPPGTVEKPKTEKVEKVHKANKKAVAEGTEKKMPKKGHKHHHKKMPKKTDK